MCLKIQNQFTTRKEARNFFSEPLIANKNITVYKVLENFNDDMLSPYQSEQYKFGELKSVNKFSSETINLGGRLWMLTINKGIHSYNPKQLKLLGNIFNLKFHTVAKCVIPKGTPYFKNDREYVSLALQMPKK